MNELAFTSNAVLPIILCIVVGYVLKILKLFPDNFWGALNKLCFRCFLPVLLFKNIYDIKDITSIGNYWQVIVFAAVAIIAIFCIGLLVVILTIKDDKQKGVVLQCIFRSNYAIIGLGLIELLSVSLPADIASAAKGVGALLSAISIPIFNILAVISLSVFVKGEDNKKISVKEILLKIIKNPLIIGVFTGIAVLALRMAIPVDSSSNPVFTLRYFTNYGTNDTFIYTAIKYLANATTPCALIALGGAFTFSAVAKLKWQIIIGTAFRTALVPTACLLVAYFLGFRNVEFPALIALFGTPVAVSSAPMASEMKNDSELAGQLVVWTSLVSAFTLFAIILICSNVGIF